MNKGIKSPFQEMLIALYGEKYQQFAGISQVGIVNQLFGLQIPEGTQSDDIVSVLKENGYDVSFPNNLSFGNKLSFEHNLQFPNDNLPFEDNSLFEDNLSSSGLPFGKGWFNVYLSVKLTENVSHELSIQFDDDTTFFHVMSCFAIQGKPFSYDRLETGQKILSEIKNIQIPPYTQGEFECF